MLSNDLPGKVQSCTVICKSLAFWLRIRAMLCPKVMLSASSPNESQSHSYSREGICKKHIRHRHDSPQVCSTKMHQTTLKPTKRRGWKTCIILKWILSSHPKTIATSTDFKDPIPTASGSAPILPWFFAGSPSASCICSEGVKCCWQGAWSNWIAPFRARWPSLQALVQSPEAGYNTKPVTTLHKTS